MSFATLKKLRETHLSNAHRRRHERKIGHKEVAGRLSAAAVEQVAAKPERERLHEKNEAHRKADAHGSELEPAGSQYDALVDRLAELLGLGVFGAKRKDDSNGAERLGRLARTVAKRRLAFARHGRHELAKESAHTARWRVGVRA